MAVGLALIAAPILRKEVPQESFYVGTVLFLLGMFGSRPTVMEIGLKGIKLAFSDGDQAGAAGAQREEFGSFFSVESEALRHLATLLVGDADRGAELAERTLAATYLRWPVLSPEQRSPYAIRTLVGLAGGVRLLGRPGRPTPRGSAGWQWSSRARALATLSPMVRAEVLLHDLRNMRDEEIADVLGRPLPIVRSDIQKALALLAPALGEPAPALV